MSDALKIKIGSVRYWPRFLAALVLTCRRCVKRNQPHATSCCSVVIQKMIGVVLCMTGLKPDFP